MTKKIFKFTSALTAIALITGCAATGEQHKANVYRAGQLNQAQNSQVVKILSIQPAQVEVDNSQGKKQAEVAGALLGALAGASATKKAKNNDSKAAGVAAGAAAGAAAGSLVSDKTLVDGVQLTYNLNGKLITSVQVGKSCEFAKGEAIMISTTSTETRIQPNAECPKK